MKTFLLQESISNQQVGSYAIMFGAMLIFGIIFLLLAKWLLGISDLISYHKIQCRILSKIAQAQGVSKEDIDKIMKS